jgi:hypothetical protein
MLGSRATRRNAALLIVAALVATVAVAAPIAGGEGPGAAQISAKKKPKCKKKGGSKAAKGKKRCKRKVKFVPSTLTINCPTGTVDGDVPATITGTLSPDAKGNSPMGADWNGPPPGGVGDVLEFGTAPGGAFSFTFVPNKSPPPGDWITTVRVAFAGDALFSDRRPATAECSWTSTP